MNERVTIRRANGADAQAIAEQGATAFREAFERQYAPAEIEAYLQGTYGEGVQTAELADDTVAVFVAEADGRVVGHVKLGPSGLPHGWEGLVLEVRRLYVLAAWHGTGVAHRLLRSAADEAVARGARAVCLSCWTENVRALRFYRREGFRVVGTHPFPMGERVDTDYVMLREV